jgi:hypothetical protein
MRLQRAWQPQAVNERLRCVVVESGASGLRQAGGFDETVVVAQMRGEPPFAFAQRVTEKIATVERSGRHFESATVLAGDQRDRASKAARRLVVLALSAHARARGGMSELALVSAAEGWPERSAELLGLAEELMVLPNADSVPVRVRFRAGVAPEDQPSGIFPAVGASKAQSVRLRSS